MANIHRNVFVVIAGAVLFVGFLNLLAQGVSYYFDDPAWCGRNDACGREWIIVVATVAAMGGTAAAAALAWASLQHQIKDIKAMSESEQVKTERDNYIQYVTYFCELDRRLLRSMRVCARILTLENSISVSIDISEEIADTVHELQYMYTVVSRNAAMSGAHFPLGDRIVRFHSIVRPFVEQCTPLAHEAEGYLVGPNIVNPNRMYGVVAEYRDLVRKAESAVLDEISSMNAYLGKMMSATKS
jgi:hypothetical protein